MAINEKLAEKAFLTIKQVLNGVPLECVQKAANIVTKSDVSIPFLTDDENVIKYIKEFELTDPRNFSRFIVESFYAQFDAVQDSIRLLNRVEFQKSASNISSARTMINIIKSDKKRMTKLLDDAQNKIISGTDELIRLEKEYVQFIMDVDKRSRFSFFIKSKASLKDVDLNNHLAKASIQSLIDAYNLQIYIGAQLNDNIDVVHNVFFEFSEWMKNNNIFRLMHAYDDEPEKEFWLTVPQTIPLIKNKGTVISAYLEAAQEEYSDEDEINYEEDINFD